MKNTFCGGKKTVCTDSGLLNVSLSYAIRVHRFTSNWFPRVFNPLSLCTDTAVINTSYQKQCRKVIERTARPHNQSITFHGELQAGKDSRRPSKLAKTTFSQQNSSRRTGLALAVVFFRTLWREKRKHTGRRFQMQSARVSKHDQQNTCERRQD